MLSTTLPQIMTLYKLRLSDLQNEAYLQYYIHAEH